MAAVDHGRNPMFAYQGTTGDFDIAILWNVRNGKLIAMGHHQVCVCGKVLLLKKLCMTIKQSRVQGSLLFMGTEIATILGSSSDEVDVPCALRHGIYAIEAGAEDRESYIKAKIAKLIINNSISYPTKTPKYFSLF